MFSNFSQYGFVLNGIEYKTVEHYFQSQKFMGTEHEKQIIAAPTAFNAAKLGRD